MANKPHILITAGPTREMIDQVRDWGNIFTGRTGLDLALACLDLGDVTLITSNSEHAKAYDGYYGKAGMLGVELFRSYDELRELLTERMTGAGQAAVDIVAMSAAVTDYSPAGAYRIVEKKVETNGRETWVVENVSAPKVKSGQKEIAFRGTMTEKLIDMFRTTWNFHGTLIKFKLEVGISEEELVRIASASRLASGADLMVANTLGMARPSDGTEGAGYLIDDAGAVRVARKELAGRIVQWMVQRQATAK
jgi:phosphopantothenate-cysteine ligase/phosphopantothenoylcysteine decarboxylase/phosphopantothenate--cysteine ligase